MYLTLEEFMLYDINNLQLTETQFANLEYKARTKVDKYTQNRIISIETIPENIKRLMVEIINILYNYNQSNNQIGNVKSVSNDGYSVTYNDINTEKSDDTLENKIYSLITEYAKDYCWRGLY